MSAASQPPEHNPDPLLDIAQAAQYSGLSVRFLRRLTHEERIPVVRIGGRVRFRRSDLDALLAAHTRPATRTGRPADKTLPPPKKRVRKLNTEAAPTDRIIYAERADPTTPPASAAGPGPSGNTEDTGPAAG